MRKLMFTMATPEVSEIGKPFLLNHAAYAKRNGYEYVVYRERFPGEFFKDNHPSFSKVPYALAALKDGYDAVLYGDLDVAFVTQGVDLVNLLLGTEYWFGAYHQQNWPESPYLNAGLFVTRQCEDAVKFFEEWVHRCITGCPDWVPGKLTPILDFPWENWLLHGLCRKYQYKGIRCCNAKEIGCFCPDIWHDSVIWTRDCPTIHFAGQMATWPQRVAIFKNKYARFVN